ncbi:MAG: tRNA uridine-5-carboxymethylaminomethyl(34) synthesis GTPase MnmE [Pseudomonadota bacterium]
MMTEIGATIFARASAPGRAGVAVFRVSGPRVADLVSALTTKPLVPRMAHHRVIHAHDGSVIDHGIMVYFQGPASFTGEDVLELHLHGAPAVARALFRTLEEAGCVLAEPGEFSLRALQNGKMDLAAAEGLSDLLAAETDGQRHQALRQYGGALSDQATAWRTDLIKILASIAADIDFPDEEDVPADVIRSATLTLEHLTATLSRALETADYALRVREGVTIALIGAPNAGKSSLLNRLAGSDLAIVSDEPGTTRDIVETPLEIAGQLVRVADTAGIRLETESAIEKEGIRRTMVCAQEADRRVLVVDASEADFTVSRETIDLLQSDDVILLNKADQQITGALRSAAEALAKQTKTALLTLSAKTGDGVTALTDYLAEDFNETAGSPALLTRERHVSHVRQARDALGRAKENLHKVPELAAEDIRLAARAFDHITGKIHVEEVLGDVFSNFCIGK